MDDNILLELYLKKDPRALEGSLYAHGYTYRRIAMNILAGEREAEACVREAAERAVMAVNRPADMPANLGIYLQKLTHACAVKRYAASQSVKRGYSLFTTILEELGENLSMPVTEEKTALPPQEGGHIGGCLNQFLCKKSRETRDIFICRYFFAQSLGEITDRFGLLEHRVRSRLHRACKQLSSFMDSRGIRLTPDLLMAGISHVDDALIASAQGGAKRIKRLIPWVATACVIGLLAVSFPYLRQVINTDLVLRDPDWNKETDQAGDAEIPHKPTKDSIKGLNAPASLGGSTLTVTAVTETTVTLTLTKTDDTPLYAALYDRMGDALACTDPSYKVDGVTIRPGRIKVYALGSTEPSTELPTPPGTYTLTIDFISIRNGSYPMEEYIGFLTYTGKDSSPIAVYFSLTVPEEATPEATESEAPITGTSTEAECSRPTPRHGIHEEPSSPTVRTVLLCYFFPIRNIL